ncbi:MAG: TonB family protein [Ignavibacteriales bacterium]|nr:TonB family protein [Ignavibacteriales bacterium]
MLKKIVIIFILSYSVCFSQNGIATAYYSNDVVRYELSYVNDVLEGPSYWYYSNGNLESQKTYNDGILNGMVKNFFESGLIKDEFSVKEGILDGVNKSYYENGSLKNVKYYDRGKLVKETKFEFDQFYVASVSEYEKGSRQKKTRKEVEKPLCDADVCPEPIGGMDAIMKNLVYPIEAEKYGLEGIVSVIVTIDVDGYVSDAKVLSGIGLGCDEAAIDAIKKTRFLPGIYKNKNVEASVILKVEFKQKK